MRRSALLPKSLLKSKFYWVGVLYFAQGFPLGVFYEILPVDLRQQGVALSQIGFLSLLGLAWTIKFLWAPLVGHLRNFRRWMLAMDLAMAVCAGWLAASSGFSGWLWVAVGLFTLFSATNDIAIDAYTIELLDKREMGLGNGLRIGFYRVGLLTAGGILMLQPIIGWSGVYAATAVILVLAGFACFAAPTEQPPPPTRSIALSQELRGLINNPIAFATVIVFLLGALWLVDQAIDLQRSVPSLWIGSFIVGAGLIVAQGILRARRTDSGQVDLSQGPAFGALLDMMRRPFMPAVAAFILLFKLADTSIGFMIKPFWVDAGFTPQEIGLVSVNIGIGLSVFGALVGGWVTDRIGIFKSLWILGLFQALSNLGYVIVANVLPTGPGAGVLSVADRAVMYGASGFESFTQGLGTAAFLAFLMAIVNKQRSAAEYALLSALFVFNRSVAGWAGGFGAEILGYADYFLLTFFLAFPAYLLLPWVKRMLHYAESRPEFGQSDS